MNSPSVHSSGQHSGRVTSSVDGTVLDALPVIISVAWVCPLASEVWPVGWFASVVPPLKNVEVSVIGERSPSENGIRFLLGLNSSKMKDAI